MTVPVPPADLLHAAAVFVRLVADANTAISSNRPIPRVVQGRTRAEVARATMHPAVGRALADWLEAAGRQEAYTLAEFGHRGGAGPHAVAVARAVLGEGEQP